MALSRWRPAPDGNGGWFVKSEDGALAETPSDFIDYGDAIQRATDLNRGEQYAQAGLGEAPPMSTSFRH